MTSIKQGITERRRAELESIKQRHATLYREVALNKIERSNLLRAANERGLGFKQLAKWEGKTIAMDIYASFLSRTVRIVDEKPDGYITINQYELLSGLSKVKIWVAIVHDEITDQILYRNMPFLKWEG
jgi:hypothetical protein